MDLKTKKQEVSSFYLKVERLSIIGCAAGGYMIVMANLLIYYFPLPQN